MIQNDNWTANKFLEKYTKKKLQQQQKEQISI